MTDDKQSTMKDGKPLITPNRKARRAMAAVLRKTGDKDLALRVAAIRHRGK